MSRPIPYVSLRDGVYYYVRRIPVDIAQNAAALSKYFDGKQVWRRSLRAKTTAEGLAAAIVEAAKFERLLDLARGIRKNGVLAAPMILRPVTPYLLDQIIENVRDMSVNPWRRANLLAELGGATVDEWARMIAAREEQAESYMTLLKDRAASSTDPSITQPRALADDLITMDMIDAPAHSDAWASVVGAVRKGLLLGQRDIDDLIDGKGQPTLSAKRGAEPNAASLDGISLGQCVNEYVEDRLDRHRSITAVRAALANFTKLLGDKSLTNITREDFRSFMAARGASQVGGKTAGSITRPISASTIRKDVRLLSAAIGHAIDKGRHDGENPARGHRAETWVRPPNAETMPEKRGFKVDEINAILEHRWFLRSKGLPDDPSSVDSYSVSAKYWVPLVALWTGCRASELGGIKTTEVILDGPHPHLVIRANEHRGIKGAHSRVVPLIDALMDQGFGRYVDSVRCHGSGRLFPGWTAPVRTGAVVRGELAWSNASLIRSFNRSVVPIALAGRLHKGARLEVTFHSFRGAFKAMLGLTMHRLPANVINEVVGHAKDRLDQSYVGTIPIEETYPAIRGCNYPGLIVPVPMQQSLEAVTQTLGAAQRIT